MTTTIRFITALCALVSSTLATVQAEEPCPASRSSKFQAWHSDCFEISGSKRLVKKKHLHKLRFNKSGFATIEIGDPTEYVAVNKNGVIVIPGIRWGTRDYPSSPSGVSRFYARDSFDSTNSRWIFKCGYFKTSNFSIIVPAIYDHCTAFIEGTGSTCSNCIEYCCSWSCFASGLYGNDSSITFNKNGKQIERASLPRVEEACEGGAAPTIREIDGIKVLECPKPLPEIEASEIERILPKGMHHGQN